MKLNRSTKKKPVNAWSKLYNAPFSELTVERLAEVTSTSPKAWEKGKFKDYEYWIHRGRNRYLGTVIFNYEGKALPIRGYPKIKYLEDGITTIQNNFFWVERKLNGTNLLLVYVPELERIENFGVKGLIVKTRETVQAQSYGSVNFLNLLSKAPLFEPLLDFIKQFPYLGIFIELYGRLNPIDEGTGVFYKIPVEYRILDVYSFKSYDDCYTFANLFQKYELEKVYGLPVVETLFTANKLEDAPSAFIKYLEDLSRERIDTGDVGVVVKSFVNGDVLMWKEKPRIVKEILLSKRNKIPTFILRRALQKAMQELGMEYNNWSSVMSYVVNQLKEEFTPEQISRSLNRVYQMWCNRMDDTAKQKLVEFFYSLPLEKLKDKGVALKLASQEIKCKPSFYYQVWQMVIKERCKDE